MANEKKKITLDLTHCYLEIARSSIVSLSLDDPKSKCFLQEHGYDPIVNATISIVSVTIIFSYLSIESFINYHLYRIWEKRADHSYASKRFLEIFGAIDDFRKLKTKKKVKELGERIKTLFELLSYPKPHEVNPRLWQDFKDLNEISRHFLVHPYPSDQFFNENLRRIGLETPTEKYVNMAQEILPHFYKQGGLKPPDWLNKNTLVRFEGIRFLWDDDEYT